MIYAKISHNVKYHFHHFNQSALSLFLDNISVAIDYLLYTLRASINLEQSVHQQKVRC